MRPRNSISAILGLLLWLPLFASAQGDPATLRVQILSGKTGRPVANQRLRLLRKDGRPLEGSGNATTDGEGYAPIPNVDTSISEVVVLVDLHRPCSKTDKHTFSLQQARAAGVVSENSCRPRITLFPQAGTLVFFVRDETFFEKMRH